MKIGIAISVVIVLFLGLIAFLSTRGVPDLPTSATSPEKLAKVGFPDDLPSFQTPANPDADAESRYVDALRYFLQPANYNALTAETPDPTRAAELAAKLIDAMNAGQLADGFFDPEIPMKRGEIPNFGDALERIPTIVLDYADAIYAGGQTDEGFQAALSVWVFGQRLFEKNVRLYNRRLGLEIMKLAGASLFEMQSQIDEGEARLRAWNRRISEVELIWQPKIEMVLSTRPPVADLLQIARHDEDLTFRVAATMALGVVKFNPGSRGNLRVINDTIEAHSQEPGLVGEAAQAAAALTLEELRRMR